MLDLKYETKVLDQPYESKEDEVQEEVKTKEDSDERNSD